ncbi:protein TPRXL [Janibacter cremeus]|uniref:Lipoprotein n=1 Tax=Janibacter cremeus TaxID=1285192 RepID=A0A852VZ99_9MICO|nr:protein TPRXL [Janibacter cremeus]NYF98791.1 hypothetical protein [Janibacter cremeus]
MHSGEGSTLREQLGGTPDPDFEIKLPTGWERRSPDDADRERFEAGLKQRFMRMQRPDLFAQVREMLRESYDGMRREGAIAFYTATGESQDTAWVPGSLVVSLRRPPTGETLDGLVKHAIREYGAAPLFGDTRFVRFEQQKKVTVEGGTIAQTTIVYLTPIPGSKRRRALQFTASFGRPVEAPTDDERGRAYTSLFDLMVSTLRWHPPTSDA